MIERGSAEQLAGAAFGTAPPLSSTFKLFLGGVVVNLLAEIEGLSGENLTTSVLRLLLLRSEEIREEFIKLLSSNSRAGPFTSGSHFSCILEQYTEEADSTRWGRLDLLIETTDAVIGLENKLFAEFQEGQPQKYLETIRKHSIHLAEFRHTSLLYLVAVIAPQSRYKDVSDRIGDDEHLLSVPWEDVIDVIDVPADCLDQDTKVLLRSLKSFLEERLAFIPKFSEWVPHLRRRFNERGTAFQQDVVRKIWEFFPDAGPRLSAGATWAGYYFPSKVKHLHGWYGYIPSNEIEHGSRYNAELIIATSFPVQLPNPPFRPIKLNRGPKFLGLKTDIFTWAIDYDETWAKPQIWRYSLIPIYKAVENLVNRQTE